MEELCRNILNRFQEEDIPEIIISVERGYHFEVDSLTIQSATDVYGEYMIFDNTDKDMIYNLTQILEDKLNEN